VGYAHLFLAQVVLLLRPSGDTKVLNSVRSVRKSGCYSDSGTLLLPLQGSGPKIACLDLAGAFVCYYTLLQPLLLMLDR
jgi:hypothetical protein